MADGLRQRFASGRGPHLEPERGERAERELEVESTAVTKALLLACSRRKIHSQPGRPYAAASSAPVWELLPIANRPVLFHTLDWLDAAGIHDVAVVVDRTTGGEVRDAIAAEDGWRLKVRCLAHEADAGLGEVLSAAEPFLQGDPFMLHLGDSLTRTRPDGLLTGRCLDRFEAVVFLDEARSNVVELAGGRLTGGTRGLGGRPREALAGIVLFGCDVVDVARELPSLADCELDVLATLERLWAHGGRVKARVLDGWWRYRRQPDALLDANRFMLEGVRGAPTAAWVHASHVQGNVTIHDSAVIESTTIRGPAIIGPRARLMAAYVGPYTSIGADVVVEGAEIEHSIVCPGARISHLGARLEASVIGPEARVFRDFKLPKGLRLYVGEGAEVSLA
jgi:glucose-1-phosphate thymidylyltransferase